LTQIAGGSITGALMTSSAVAAARSGDPLWQVICPFCGSRGPEASTAYRAWQLWDHQGVSPDNERLDSDGEQTVIRCP